MPRAKIETAFLGYYTLVALDAAPDLDAAWLIHTLCAWILRDELPTEIPPELTAVWTVVRAESELIAASMKESANARIEAAKEAAAARWRKRTDADGCVDDAKGCQAMLESKRESKSKISSANAGGASRPAPAPAREPWEPCEECPLEEDIVRSEARRVGLDEKELENWRDYWTMREWRSDPRSARPMTRAGVKSSIRRWATEKGIREAREAHLDAKADERALAVAAAREAARDPHKESDPAAVEAMRRAADEGSVTVVGFDENGLAIVKKGRHP